MSHDAQRAMTFQCSVAEPGWLVTGHSGMGSDFCGTFPIRQTTTEIFNVLISCVLSDIRITLLAPYRSFVFDIYSEFSSDTFAEYGEQICRGG